MLDILLDTILDSLKLLPFLFVAFLIIELIEHKYGKKMENFASKSGKFGPFIGSLLGLIPQCGFSVFSTNLYITRVISLGTLISIYLSTSDEMLPIMISEGISFKYILLVLVIKFICGVIFGFLIDLILFRKKDPVNYNICEHDHCDCGHNIFGSSLIHTLKIFIFIFICSFILNYIISFYGNDFISSIFLKNKLFGPFFGAFVGLIPNCGSSVIITEMFLKKVISLGTCISGLLTNSGVALLVLFKNNGSLKDSFKIITLLYLIGVLVGFLIELISIFL